MKQLALATLMFFTTAVVAPGIAIAQTTQATKTSALTVPVTGAGGGGTFTGTMQIQRFATQNNQLVATGIVSGVFTSATGAATSVVQTVTVPAAVTNATCDILHLDLGPLHLDILGLVVDLNRIVLDITAESGAGNLLGNLLCGVAGLLDNPGGLAKLLNQILGILG
jgi:hypothetical protein